MLIHNLTAKTIESSFGESDYTRGYQYFLQKRVSNLTLEQETPKEERFRSVVMGTKEYTVTIELNNINGTLHLWGHCSCPLMSGCKHVIATLFEALSISADDYNNMKSDPDVVEWVKQFEHDLKYKTVESESSLSCCLFYVLSASIDERMKPYLQIYYAKRLKSGKWGTAKNYGMTGNFYSRNPIYPNLAPSDQALLMQLEGMKSVAREVMHYGYYPLEGIIGEKLLDELLASGRCYWEDMHSLPLKKGPSVQSDWYWQTKKNGFQILRYKNESAYFLFSLEKLWYFNEKTHEIGVFETEINKKAIPLLLSMPPIPKSQAESIANVLIKHKKEAPVPLPKSSEKKSIREVIPIPHLYLSGVSLTEPDDDKKNREKKIKRHAAAVLTFDYDGHRVTEKDQSSLIADTDIQRNLPKEAESIRQLAAYGWESFQDRHDLKQVNAALPDHYLLNTEKADPLYFSGQILPKLREQGWQIEIDAQYPYQLIDEPIDDWYSSIEEDEASGRNWFDLELGITVKGQKVNLLPVIQRLLVLMREKSGLLPKLSIEERRDSDEESAEGRMPVSEIDNLGNNPDLGKIPPGPPLQRGETFSEALQKGETFYAQLNDGRYIPLPTERVKHILSILIELYDEKSLNSGDKLRLSALHAMRLLELDNALQLRWLGGDRLLKMAEKLAHFKGIEIASPPAEFQGTLRPYQLEGLSWLQFLREYHLSGILADDMGLGKTVQALAHLLLEKTSGRMKVPSLIIAPTSLMFNWQMETARFAPDLKILVLHGAERQHEKIEHYDLVITTYALLVRDKAILLKQDFYYFILDEAQFIKNAKTQAAQIALQIKATHRLCLTGTPMENHLGELWSLFHFMMPGLLGNQKQFTQLFRTPIEKNNDQERRAHLNRRIAPFMLRRTKDNVIKELPKKIETIQYIELEGAQRDLYETVRVSMQTTLQEQIAASGIGRSHIFILDALLKLRQVCCDPRLLKISAARKKEAPSAKLTLLISFIQELLEEGRRILLFSQFTEMLGLIEQALISEKIAYVKLTGQTKDRQTPVEQFQSGQVPLFLISLKAGGTGLNLTAADTVIHYDPWWNPAVENQATDRAHRIGQNKTVFVYKFVAKGTVEEKILEMQKSKRALMEGLFSGEVSNKLTEKDLKVLFTPLE